MELIVLKCQGSGAEMFRELLQAPRGAAIEFASVRRGWKVKKAGVNRKANLWTSTPRKQ